MSQRIFIFFIAFLTAFVFSTHAYAGGDGDINNDFQYVSIGELRNDVEKYKGRMIIVRGEYCGWHGEGLKNPFITRSDWVMKDATGGIYVSGRMPVEMRKGVNKGINIEVKGRFLLSRDNVPYIKAIEITLN
ncbi:MAG: hypothetical protein SVY10_07415 [Thermodesulfobacteriota bacterium]|nr:hypothetical protein [Thermodesulfobacteriota bacterium]